MGVEPPSHFCGNNEVFAARFAHLCNQLLGVSIAIDISGIDEVDAQIDSSMEGSQGCGVVGGTPVTATDAPGAKTNGRDVPASTTDGSVFQLYNCRVWTSRC